MKKNIITVFSIIIILASCAPTVTPILPTETASPLPTFTMVTPSTTLLPTKIPNTPTEVEASNADFLANSDNAFPLVENQETGLVDYYGYIDFGKLDFTIYAAPDSKTKIYISFAFQDGNVNFIVPEQWVSPEVIYKATSVTANANDGGTPSDAYFQNSIAKHLESMGVTGQRVRVKLTLDTGLKNGTTPMLGYIDPFIPLWQATDWDEAVRKFMKTGDPNDLPELNGTPMLPAVRIVLN